MKFIKINSNSDRRTQLDCFTRYTSETAADARRYMFSQDYNREA